MHSCLNAAILVMEASIRPETNMAQPHAQYFSGKGTKPLRKKLRALARIFHKPVGIFEKALFL
jgi:hypothetical protein